MKKHRIIYGYGSMTFWKDGVAASSEEEWTHCIIDAPGSSNYVVFTRKEHDAGMAHKVLHMLHRAYELGRKDKAKEIRKVLESAK